jgi:hypothetical protein
MLRCLVQYCLQLKKFNLYKENITEAELLYLINHAKNMQAFGLQRWGHLFFRDRVVKGIAQEYASEELLLFGVDEKLSVRVSG